jgi:hypothetical protein
MPKPDEIPDESVLTFCCQFIFPWIVFMDFICPVASAKKILLALNAGTKLPKKFSPSKDRSQSILIFFMFDISFKGLGSSESNSSSPQNFNELKEEQEDKNITRKGITKNILILLPSVLLTDVILF